MEKKKAEPKGINFFRTDFIFGKYQPRFINDVKKYINERPQNVKRKIELNGSEIVIEKYYEKYLQAKNSYLSVLPDIYLIYKQELMISFDFSIEYVIAEFVDYDMEYRKRLKTDCPIYPYEECLIEFFEKQIEPTIKALSEVVRKKKRTKKINIIIKNNLLELLKAIRAKERGEIVLVESLAKLYAYFVVKPLKENLVNYNKRVVGTGKKRTKERDKYLIEMKKIKEENIYLSKTQAAQMIIDKYNLKVEKKDKDRKMIMKDGKPILIEMPTKRLGDAYTRKYGKQKKQQG